MTDDLLSDPVVVAYMVSKLGEEEVARRARIRQQLIKRAAAHHITLEPSDIGFVEGEPEIHQMLAEEWLALMTEETN